MAPSLEIKEEAIRDLSHMVSLPSVTVHGDAGWKDGIGRWAWFVRSGIPPYKIEGVDQGTCPSVMKAETRAILGGIQAALSAWTLPIGSTFFIRTDNQEVVRQLLKDVQRVSEIDQILILLKDFTCDVKHVPGHGKSRGRAAWVNNRVDATSNLRGSVGRERLKQ